MNRKELVDKLELVNSVINSNSFVPEFKNFNFQNELLTATDGTISIRTSSPFPNNSFAVKADSFLNLLRNIDAEEVEFKFAEASLLVNTDRIEGRFKINKPRILEFPHNKNAIDLDKCKDLISAINYCRYGVNKEKTSGAVSGVRINPSKVFSTDRFRIHRYILESPTLIEPCTLPIKFVDILLRNKERIVKYGFQENKFYIIIGDDTQISTSVFSEEYPELDQYFESFEKDSFVELGTKTKLYSIIERHLKSFLSEIDIYDREMNFSISGTKCIINSKNKEGDYLVEQVELDKEVPAMSFIVNPNLLEEVLQYGKSRFLYHPEAKIISLDVGKLQVLIQTKV